MSHQQTPDDLAGPAHLQTVVQDAPTSKTGEAFKKVRRSRKRPQPDEAAAAAGRSVVALLAEPLLPGAATATGIDQSGSTEKRSKTANNTTTTGPKLSDHTAAHTKGQDGPPTLKLNSTGPPQQAAPIAPVPTILTDPGAIAECYAAAVTAFMQLPLHAKTYLLSHLNPLTLMQLQHSAGLGSAAGQLFTGSGSTAGAAGAAGALMPAQHQAGDAVQLPEAAPGNSARTQSGALNARNPPSHHKAPAQHSSAQGAVPHTFVPAASTGAAVIPDAQRFTNRSAMVTTTRTERGPAAAASGANTEQPGAKHGHQARSVGGAGLAQAVAEASTEELSHLLRGSDRSVLRSVGERLNCSDKAAYVLAGHMFHALMLHPSLAHATTEQKMGAILWVAMKNTCNRSKFTASSEHGMKKAAAALGLPASDLERLEILVLQAIDWRPYKAWPLLLPAAEGELD